MKRDAIDTTEERTSLWTLTLGPATWAVHFLLCYATAAVWCAKVAGPDGPLGPARLAIAGYTLVALVVIGVVAWRGFRRHSIGQAAVPHDFDTRDDRTRFLGFATLLLAGLSFVATLYVALAAVFVETCR
jgi:hypothetical protein